MFFVPLLWTIATVLFYTKILSTTSLPQLASLFDQSFLFIFKNYLSTLKFLPLIFGPYLLSLMTLKKSQKNYFGLFALSLIVFHFLLKASDPNESETNLVLNESRIILGTYRISACQ